MKDVLLKNKYLITLNNPFQYWLNILFQKNIWIIIKLISLIMFFIL